MTKKYFSPTKDFQSATNLFARITHKMESFCGRAVLVQNICPHTHTCLSMWHIHTNCNDNLAKAFAGGKKYSSELKICASEEWWARGGSCFKLLSDRALCCRFFSASCLTSTVRLLIATHLLHTFPMQLLHIFKRCCCNSCCNCTVTHGTVVTPAV